MNIYYDFTYFLRPEETVAEETLEKIKNEIKKMEGVIIEETIPEKKPLAYEIEKNKHGIFGAIKFLLNPGSLSAITKKLEKDKNILRFSAVKIREKDEARPPKKKNKILVKKTVVPKKQDEAQLAEIDKKIDELLGK